MGRQPGIRPQISRKQLNKISTYLRNLPEKEQTLLN